MLRGQLSQRVDSTKSDSRKPTPKHLGALWVTVMQQALLGGLSLAISHGNSLQVETQGYDGADDEANVSDGPRPGLAVRQPTPERFDPISQSVKPHAERDDRGYTSE